MVSFVSMRQFPFCMCFSTSLQLCFVMLKKEAIIIIEQECKNKKDEEEEVRILYRLILNFQGSYLSMALNEQTKEKGNLMVFQEK